MELPDAVNDVSTEEIGDRTVIDFIIGSPDDYTDWRDICAKSSVVIDDEGVLEMTLRFPTLPESDYEAAMESFLTGVPDGTVEGLVVRMAMDESKKRYPSRGVATNPQIGRAY